MKIIKKYLGKTKRKFLEKRRAINLEKNGDKVLKKIFEISEKENLKVWLEFGTLLGIVRNGGFIKYDTDIDLGFINQNNIDLKRILEKYGIIRKFYWKVNGELSEERYTYLNVGIDIFRFYMNNDKLATKCFVNKLDKQHVLEFSFTPFEKLIIYNETGYLIPENYSTCIIEKYGEDWMIPNSNWKIDDSPACKYLSKDVIVDFCNEH